MTARRIRRYVVAATMTIGLAQLAGSSSASAGEAEGCRGSASSYGPNGGLLDSVVAPGDGGTAEDPFDIFADSRVEYEGTTDVVVRNGSWSVDVGGVIGAVASVVEVFSDNSPLSGQIGDGGELTRQGEFLATDYVGKLRLSGLHQVTVRLTGEGGATCTATVWVRLHQDFFKSLLAVGGLGFLLFAMVLFYVGAPVWAIENLSFQMLESGLSPPAEGGSRR